MAGKKPSAADRTLNMFGAAPKEEERPIEVLEEEAKAERVPLEQDVDRLRANAFLAQEWTSRAFGDPESFGNEYRVTYKNKFYYLESLSKVQGSGSAHGYTGVMVHERDLFNMVAVLVQAVRAKQAADALAAGRK